MIERLLAVLMAVFSLAGAALAAESGTETAALTIERAVELALENNFEIQQARKGIDRQEALLLEATSQLFPRVVLLSSYDEIDPGRIQTFDGRTFGSRRNWTADVEASQTLFAGGRNWALRRREQSALEASIHELQTVINNVLLEVRERFYAVLLAAAQIEVQEANTELLREEFESEREKFRVGAVSEFNVLRTEVAYHNSRVPLIRARNEYRLALEELRLAIGLNETYEALFAVVGELRPRNVSLDLNHALQKARQQRPELKSLRSLQQAQDQTVTAERAGYFPEISAIASYGAESSRFSRSLSDYEEGWFFGVRGTWTIFDSFRTAARVRQALASSSIIVTELERVTLEIDTQVRRSYSSLIEAEELLQASRRVIEQAQESFRLARSRFEAGVATQLDVLDSQVALTQARTNHVQALFDFNVALARMERAIGSELR